MKSDTEEKYLQQVNRVIDYINSHLNEPLRVETLAREVCLSEYHFHRTLRHPAHQTRRPPERRYITRRPRQCFHQRGRLCKKRSRQPCTIKAAGVRMGVQCRGKTT